MKSVNLTIIAGPSKNWWNSAILTRKAKSYFVFISVVDEKEKERENIDVIFASLRANQTSRGKHSAMSVCALSYTVCLCRALCRTRVKCEMRSDNQRQQRKIHNTDADVLCASCPLHRRQFRTSFVPCTEINSIDRNVHANHNAAGENENVDLETINIINAFSMSHPDTAEFA